MSLENVEIVRRASEAFAAEHQPPAALAAGLVWDMSTFRGWPGTDRFRGRDGFMEFFGQWIEPYERWTQEVERVIDAGGNRVVAIGKQRGRPRGADSWVALRFGMLYTLENGEIVRAEAYATPEEALEAAGVRELATPQQNVETARRYLDAIEEGKRGRKAIEALVDEFWEPDRAYYPVRGFPESRPCHGRAEILRFLAAFFPAWEDYRYAIKDARAVGDDRVLVQEEIRAAGRASGLALEGDIYHCFWLRQGRFTRVEDHLTLKGALHALGRSSERLEAAGASEQQAHPDESANPSGPAS
jgi:ketosteroid isomerase-like protein